MLFESNKILLWRTFMFLTFALLVTSQLMISTCKDIVLPRITKNILLSNLYRCTN